MAKRFVFRLEPLLKLRKRLENEQRRVVADRLRALRTSRAALVRLQSDFRETNVRLRDLRSVKTIDVRMELREQRYAAHLVYCTAKQRLKIAENEAAVSEARTELAVRSKDRKVIEKLRERRLSEHLAAQDRLEQIEADEVATQMFLRQRLYDVRTACAHGR